MVAEKVSRRCHVKISALKGTFFEKSYLAKIEIIQLSYWFVLNSLSQSEVVCEVLLHKLWLWFSFCREVVNFYCIEHSEQIGGPDKVVEIDEAKFGKHKFNCGRVVKGQWVFGGFERESKRIFIVPVPDRTSDTLVREIKKYILPGTKIISDCWQGYQGLEKEEYVHETVNHSLNFVDPESGAFTQNIERSWRDARTGVQKYGRREEYFQEYLTLHLFCTK